MNTNLTLFGILQYRHVEKIKVGARTFGLCFHGRQRSYVEEISILNVNYPKAMCNLMPVGAPKQFEHFVLIDHLTDLTEFQTNLVPYPSSYPFPIDHIRSAEKTY